MVDPPFRLALARCNAPPNALGQRPGIIDVEAVGDNDEFLATEAVGEIGHANGRDYVQHDAFEDYIAGGVTEPIIEALEMIDIDEQQRQVPACGGSMLDGTASMHFERLAVEGASKRIATGTRQ